LDQIVNSIVEEVLALFGAGYNGLAHAGLYHLTDIPAPIQTAWVLSTALIPVLLPSSQRWARPVPSVRGLVIETLELIARQSWPPTDSECTFQLNYQGEVDALIDPATTIAQLLDPDPSSPVFLTGLRLPIVADRGFAAPMSCAWLWNLWKNQTGKLT
jgi:hypothetical protein